MRNLKRTLSLFLAALMLASFMEPAAMVYASEPQTEPTAQTVEQDTSAQNGAAPVEGLADAQTIESVQPDPVTQPQADTDSDPKVPPEEPADKPEAPTAHLSGTMVVSADDIIVSYADLYKKGDAVTTKVTISAKIKNDDGPITDWMQRFKTDAPKASINAKVNYPEPGVEPVRNQRDSKADFIQIKETANVSFTKESLGLDTVVRRLKNVTIPVTLEVEVGGSLITIEETATFNIIFTNEPPEAGFTLVTNEMAKIDPDGRFFYVGKTITLTDKASDPEDDLASNEITIKKDGAAVAVIEDGKWLTGGPASKGQAVTNTGVTPDGTFTFQFSDPGTYTIEQEVTDTWGETTREVKTVKVSAAPEAPVSKIKVSSDYSLENETIRVSDVSTDPNDDIVKWEWDEVLIQNADGSTAPAAGNVTGSLKNKGPEDSEDVVPGGELTFSKRGTYVIGLTVTDVLGASNKSTITIKIVDNVPILKITPSNGIVNGKPVVSALTKPLWANAFEKADAFDPHFSAAADLPSGTPTISGAEYLVVKQNRAVYLDTAESFGNGIRDKDTQWVFSNVNGYANFVEQNVVFEDRASNDRHKLFIAKEPGCFQLTVTLHNDYSDELAQSNPNDPSLVARTKTLIVVVVPDEAPEVVLSVINDEVPSFDENPSSITVHVSASAKSVDNDMLAKYEWKVFCDKNNDGDFTNDGTYFQKTGTGLAEIDIPIRFATVAGNYKVQLTVTEAIGQTTITKYLDKTYAKQTTVSSTFNVNWSPTIDFQLSDFAYTDDTVRTGVKVKDEALATCVVDWELWRSTDSVNFTKVNPSTLPVCSLTASNIEMRIASPGYYMLKATITDAEGHSTSHTANVIRIYDLPQAVISDGVQYRWQNEPWTYKEARKFTLSGANSRADDIAGKALHEIDHDKDMWSITPLEGQDSSNILVEDLDGTLQLSLDNFYFKMSHKEFNQQLAILAPGKYQVDYSVVNTYGKRSVPVSQVITIAPDTAPIVSAVVNNPTPVPDANGNMYATFILNFITFKSDDNDYIDDGFYSIKFAYDADNDGDFDDENWQTVRMRDLEFTSATRYEKLAKYSTNQTGLGNYKFSFWAKDTWADETLDSVPDSARKETTFEVVASVDNTAPSGTFTIRKIIAGDVVLSGARSIVRENLQKTSETYSNQFGGEAGGTKLDVVTERIDAGSQSVTADFPWIKDMSSSIGNISFDPRKSNNVNMVGNPSRPGKNAFYYLDENPNSQKFTFGYNLNFGDSFNAAGMLIGIKKEGNQLVGYMLSLNNYSWKSQSNASNGGLWKVRWTLSNNSSNVESKTLLKGLDISQSGNLEVTYDGKEIVVKQGAKETVIAVPEIYGYGYGFFSDHYSHGCDSIGSFQLTDITLETSNWKNLEQICLESTWRVGSEKFVIFATDIEEEIMWRKRAQETLSAEDQNFNAILNSWTTVGGQVWAANNNTLYCSMPGGWNNGRNGLSTIIYNPLAMETDDVTISFTANGTASQLMEGVCWRVNRNADGTFNGYFMNVGSHVPASSGIGLMKFENIEFGTYASNITEWGNLDLGKLIWCWFQHYGKPAAVGQVREYTGNGHNARVTFLGTYPGALNGDIIITVEDNHFTVTYNGNQIFNVTDNSFAKGSYGFWGNNCEMSQSMLISNLVVTTFGETTAISDDFSRLVALLEAQNIHVIIMHSAENKAQMEEFVNSLSVPSKAIQINRISEYNQKLAIATQFIKDILLRNANNSWWVTVNDTVEYQKFYEDVNKDPQWLYTDSNPNWDNPRINVLSQQQQIFWDDPSYLAQYFWYSHKADTFDNSMGIANFHQSRLNKEITNFQKVGTYSTNYKVKDNPVPNKSDNTTENPFDSFRLWSNDYGNDIINEITGQVTNPYQPIYVHRVPIAAFSLNASRNASGDISRIQVQSSAYDLDHNVSDQTKKGLQEYKWTFSDSEGVLHTGYFTDEAQGVQWINDMINTVDFSYIQNASVIYQVRDYDGADTNETIRALQKINGMWTESNVQITKDGAWSEPNYVWIANREVAPIALFETNKSTYDIGEAISIIDYSYSPCFDRLTSWTWSVQRTNNPAEKLATFTDNNISSAQQRIFQWIDNRKLETTDEGNTYSITLMVTDAHGRKSPEYTRQIIISPSNNPPTVTGNTNTVLTHNNPTIYEYDPYDETLTNPYYNNEKRGLERFNLGLAIQDIDNTDKYGPANDSTRFRVQYMFERYTTKTRAEMAANEANLSPVKAVTYPTKAVTAAQAKNSSSVLPFQLFKDNNKGLSWGNYRVTVLVTDIPNNGKPGATTQYETNPRTIALDLYVIPKLFIDDATHKLEMFFNGEPYELTMEVIPGECLEITAETGAESIGTRIVYPDGLGGTLVQEMTPIKVTKDTIKWQAIWTLPEDVEEDDLDANMFYYFDVETYTNYGNLNGEETRAKKSTQHIKVLPIKLYDFNITGVTDPSVTFTAAPSGDTNPPIFVRNMAMDLNNAESLMKLSYAFEFEITSKGMKKDNDHVVLEPVFYGWDGTAYNDELDMYYISNDKYVKLGDTNDTYGIYTSAEDDSIYLGSLSQLTLPIECRTFVDRATQKWTGRYGLPGSAVFVKKGVPLSEEDLYHTDEQGHGVLIAFNIYATKEGVSKYNYVAKGQWTKEFFQNEGTGAIINLQKQIYNQPWVTATYHIPTIVVNGDANALSNYETRPVWTK